MLILERAVLLIAAAQSSINVLQKNPRHHQQFKKSSNTLNFVQHSKVAVHAFVLMTNHVHLLMTPETTTGISQLMQSLGRYYVRYVNSTHGRSGTLWEGRYKSSLVDSEHLFLLVSRYIELNPVRAGMTEHPAAYPWSSYQHNALNRTIELLTPHPAI